MGKVEFGICIERVRDNTNSGLVGERGRAHMYYAGILSTDSLIHVYVTECMGTQLISIYTGQYGMDASASYLSYLLKLSLLAPIHKDFISNPKFDTLSNGVLVISLKVISHANILFYR
jgi:hypothetical protein